MVAGRHRRGLDAERGSTLIEVLVALIVIALGLLGLAGLQTRMQASEMEAYQRSQALILLNDMANRVAINRAAAATYVTAAPLGSGMTCPAISGTRVEIDRAEWCESLQGAAEQVGNSKLGTVIGGRGCVQDLGNNEYLITVAWQGLVPVSAPSVGVTCGKDLYDGAAGDRCSGDLCRRTVTTLVRIGTLS